MDFLTPILTGFAEGMPGVVLDLLRSRGKRCKELQRDLSSHLVWVSNWSQQVQIFGMNKPLDTEDSTISLDISTSPRKFQGHSLSHSLISEDDLLSSREHYIILGDPGAGKTTTLKRLARKLLTSCPNSSKDIWQYPIVVLFRKINKTITEELADTFGIPYEIKEKSNADKKSRYRDNEYEESKNNEKALRFKDELIFGGESLVKTIVNILDSSAPVLLLDGLDEVEQSAKEDFETELSHLALAVTNCKIILTCRSGDYQSQIQGFSITEVCPLQPKDIREISERGLSNSDEFLLTLGKVPYYELANRPLFLRHMLILFNRDGFLPERPSDVYSRILHLMLEQWNAQNQINRKTKYSGFDPTRKADFLSCFAYLLTFKIKNKVFSTEILASAYKKLCAQFSLPVDEAVQVAHEIETHTGIIIEGKADSFEFCHLVLQEYLCAQYLMRAPFSAHLGDYLREYPAPLAIMVSMSVDSSTTFAGIVLSPLEGVEKPNYTSFLSRVIQEGAYFRQDKLLGFALMRILEKRDRSSIDYIMQLMKQDQVRDSLVEALNDYRFYKVPNDNSIYSFKRVTSNYKSFESRLLIPQSGYFPKEVIDKLFDDNALWFGKEQNDDDYYVVR